LLRGRFVEENIACLVKCGTFQMGEWVLAGHHSWPLPPHRALGSLLDNATLGGLERKVTLSTFSFVLNFPTFASTAPLSTR
jgi:hypothetical protein